MRGILMEPDSKALAPAPRSMRAAVRRRAQRPADTRPEVPDHEILRKIGWIRENDLKLDL